jgi:hypothetical protein
MSSKNHRNARLAKGPRVSMIKAKSGAAAPYVREQDERRVSDMSIKPHLILCDDMGDGEAFVKKMGWRFDRVAILDEPYYLQGVRIDAGEDVWIVNEVSDEFYHMAQISASALRPGESVNFRLVRV